MDRRTFIGVLAGDLLAMPIIASAQRVQAIYHIGWLELGRAPSNANPSLDAFRGGLSEFGWVEGRNIVIEPRYAENDSSRLAMVAAELVGLKVDVIVAITTPAALAARQATSSIPIVMAGSSDPVNLGLIASLARPGGNVTGVTNNPGGEFNRKLVQLLKEAVPLLSRLALLWGGSNSQGEGTVLAEVQAAGLALGVSVHHSEARRPDDVPAALAAILQQRPDGLFVTPNSPNTDRRKLIIDFALANRLPSIFTDARRVAEGGLMSYGLDWLELRRRSATYVDRILRGAKPSDLPVEQPSRFQLAINLRTAKAIGVNVPSALLQRADEIIQ